MTSRTCIVVPTRGTPAAVERIAANIAREAGSNELLLVLNGADEAELREAEAVAAREAVQTVRCPGGGVARARNFALTACDAGVLVYTDDDVVITANAIDRLVETVASGDADVATAQVLPAKTPYREFNAIHDAYLGFDRGPYRRKWCPPGNLSPFLVWDIGVGALFGIDRLKVLQKEIRFDERLSNGRFCGGTEDVDFFMQAYYAGLTLVYEARATVHHLFPTDWESVTQKYHQYALSDGAFYTKWRSKSELDDYRRELRGWARRMVIHIGRTATKQPAVPLWSLCAEFPLKIFGGAFWYLRRAAEGEGQRERYHY